LKDGNHSTPAVLLSDLYTVYQHYRITKEKVILICCYIICVRHFPNATKTL